MKKNEIFVIVREIICDYMNTLSREDVKLESHLRKDLGMDSLDEISIVTEIECKFDIKIEDDKWLEFATVNDVVDEIMDCYNNKK